MITHMQLKFSAHKPATYACRYVCMHVWLFIYITHDSTAGHEKIVKCFDFHYRECFFQLKYGVILKEETKEDSCFKHP